MVIIYKLNGYIIIKLIYNWFIYYIDIFDMFKKKYNDNYDYYLINEIVCV